MSQPQAQSTHPITPAVSSAVLEARGLVKRYGPKRAVDGVNLKVNKAEIVGLLGPNGAGKTTTFYMLVGLVRPTEGSILLNGVEVTDMPMYRRARYGIGYLPQEECIFGGLSVYDNLLAIAQTLPLSPAQQRERCESLLHELGIEGLRKTQALALSGGEKRRLAIARSLVTSPSILLLDEPFSGVDPLAVYDIQQIILSLQQAGISILITDHNVRETLSVVDRAYLICEGKVEREGTSEFLINDPVAREMYLGPRFSM